MTDDLRAAIERVREFAVSIEREFGIGDDERAAVGRVCNEAERAADLRGVIGVSRDGLALALADERRVNGMLRRELRAALDEICRLENAAEQAARGE